MRVIERSAQFGVDRVEDVASEQPRLHVELDRELCQLGLEVGGRHALEELRVQRHRRPIGVGDVDLHLDAAGAPAGLEAAAVDERP